MIHENAQVQLPGFYFILRFSAVRTLGSHSTQVDSVQGFAETPWGHIVFSGLGDLCATPVSDREPLLSSRISVVWRDTSDDWQHQGKGFGLFQDSPDLNSSVYRFTPSLIQQLFIKHQL